MGIRHVDLERTIIAGSTTGCAVFVYNIGTVNAGCCDIWGNADGDWVGPIESQQGINGNICLDPLFSFCTADTSELYLRPDSPCAAFSEPNPECDLVGAWPVDCPPSGVPPWVAIDAGGLRLDIAPNPFTKETLISYSIPPECRTAGASVSLYDLGGRLVLNWRDEPGGSGRRSLRFDGRDASGRRLAAGAYFIRLRLGAYEAPGRLIVLP
jgi:hypothetical protein